MLPDGGMRGAAYIVGCLSEENAHITSLRFASIVSKISITATHWHIDRHQVNIR